MEVTRDRKVARVTEDMNLLALRVAYLCLVMLGGQRELRDCRLQVLAC